MTSALEMLNAAEARRPVARTAIPAAGEEAGRSPAELARAWGGEGDCS